MVPEDSLIRKWIIKTCYKNKAPELGKAIRYRFRSRFTKIFGQADVQSNLIEISGPLWKRASDEEKKQVIVHETCHIVAHYKHGHRIRSHGPEWKNCMIVAGVEPKTKHTINRDGLRKIYPKYEAVCSCTKVWINHVVAGRIRSEAVSCKRCGDRVKLTGNKTSTQSAA